MKYIYLFITLISFSVSAQTIDTSYVDGSIYLRVDDSAAATLDISATSFPGMYFIHSEGSTTLKVIKL